MSALVDSGCDKSLISKEFAISLNLTFHSLSEPIVFEVIDGTPLPSGAIKYYVICQMKLENFEFESKLYVANSTHSDIILGLDWLKKYNPIIDWENLSLELNSQKI